MEREASLGAYRAKRNFAATPEPPDVAKAAAGPAAMFVVQKHQAHRAGLHWDFRLEHGGVLWSWAVRKGPSLDPADRRLAAHVEDHPVGYADFQGTIPDGQYGAGAVETWDRGTWEPLHDADAAMRSGHLRFVLRGQRLKGRFSLIRLKPRGRGSRDAWFLIKGTDEFARAGVDAPAMEHAAPAAGAVKASLPERQAPQLCAIAEEPPTGEQWLSEIKFDGYRLLIWLRNGKATIMTRNGHDWTARLPAIAAAVGKINVDSALLDGELVALRDDGVPVFHDLQAALSEGKSESLFLYVFDLLHLNGWDLRPCRLVDRKRRLSALCDWTGLLRYSDHVQGDAASTRRHACAMKLEGIVSKRADAPYRAGRGPDWLKIRCSNREEFIVLGWTPPAGSRTGIGSLHVGYHDPDGRLTYAGGIGTGFSDRELAKLRRRLDAMAAPRPPNLAEPGEAPNPRIRWVRPELVIEARYIGWSGGGSLRHAVYLGVREDKAAAEVTREVPNAKPVPSGTRIVRAVPKGRTTIMGVELTHADRELWPGITKRDLAEYWVAIADAALPELRQRPLAIVRCPEGIDGERFFQKRGQRTLPSHMRTGIAAGSPYLALDDAEGLVSAAQISAIELHPWGATEADPLHPDRLVFDLDPGDDVPFHAVVRAARDLRDRLRDLGLASFCRTTGGKGLHLVVPIMPRHDWQTARGFCRAVAETVSKAEPARFLSTLKKADRQGRIAIDWLRNGLGATAIASFCPRARPGAPVATPLHWDEVEKRLTPSGHTLRTIPARLASLKSEVWPGFTSLRQTLPSAAEPATGRIARKPVIVAARAPRRRQNTQ